MKGQQTFFKDDWAKATEHWFGYPMAGHTEAMQKWMEREYLKAHVRIWMNDYKNQLGIEPQITKDEGQSITYAFRVSIPNGHRAIILDSRAMLSEYNDQMNLMTITTPSNTVNIIFTNDHTTETIKL